MSAAKLRKDPTILADEAATIPLTGGNKVIQITDLTETDGNSLKEGLTNSDQAAFIVAEAGELRGRSILKRLFEESEYAASIACYQDSEKDIRHFLQSFCQQHHLKITPGASEYLVQHLGSDRMVTRQELEKLILYLGQVSTITETDAIAIVGDAASHSLNSFAISIADGNSLNLTRAWANLRLQGITPVQALRATLRHFQRLHFVVSSASSGQPPNITIKKLRPPVHFSVRETFHQQVRTWSADKINRAMLILTEAERACKSTGGAGEITSSMAFLRINNAAKQLSKAATHFHH